MFNGQSQCKGPIGILLSVRTVQRRAAQLDGPKLLERLDMMISQQSNRLTRSFLPLALGRHRDWAKHKDTPWPVRNLTSAPSVPDIPGYKADDRSSDILCQ